MEFFISFLVATAAGAVCHYIIKQLDGDNQSNKQPNGCFATIKVKKTPPTVLPHG